MADGSLSACLAEIKANPGKIYVYVLSRPDGPPFYVGMGRGARLADHARAAAAGRRGRRYSIIRKAHSAGLSIGYAVAFFETKEEAATEECRLIAHYGRLDLASGVLTNLTAGGDGGLSGPETRVKLSAASRALWDDPEWRARTTAAMRAAAQTPERRAQIASARRGKPMSDEYRAKIVKANKGRKFTDDHRAKLAEAANRRWADEEFRVRATEGIRASVEKHHRGRKHTAEHRAKNSAALKGRKFSPEHRANLSKAQKDRFAKKR